MNVSKVSTEEDGAASADDEEDDARQGALPSGAPNYITPAGFTRLSDELRFLLREERPKIVDIVSWAAGNGDRSENGDYIYGKRRLREIDRRIRFLTKRLEIAKIVHPEEQKNRAQVFFGARVKYAREDDTEHCVRIVGIDEAQSDRGDISWISPLARALLKARVGDVVSVRAPHGSEAIEVIEIHYD